MQQLRFQVAQYESVLPIKDTEELNNTLRDEKREFTRSIEQLKNRLNRAEALVSSMGTLENIKKRGTSRRQEHKEKVSDQSSSSDGGEDEDSGEDEDGDEQERSSASSSSEDEHGGADS